jgi:putative ABC transport system permease protein
MRNREVAELAFNSLRHRSLRSWLAILGIIIGVASIISLISISTGLDARIKSSLGGLGANVITITSGANRAAGGFGGGPEGGFGGRSSDSKPITFNEADSLKTISGVEKVDARVSGRAEVTYRGKNTSLSIVGVEPSAFPASSAATLLSGSAFGSGDTSSAIIGYSVQSETFNNDSMLYKPIKIEGKTFRVIGILNQSGASFAGPDRTIFITQRAAKSLFDQAQNASSVVVIAQNGTNPDTVAAAVASKLQTLHRVTNSTQDFTVSTATTLQSSISSVTSTLGIFLGGIASISLIVGGIGVANAMFTSVLEQTRYIGLLKSLGARNSTVLKLFLFESAMVGFVGGILGIALSYVVSAIMSSFSLPTLITPELVLLGIGFSVIVGVVSGLIPARNASHVEPVEALRYE